MGLIPEGQQGTRGPHHPILTVWLKFKVRRGMCVWKTPPPTPHPPDLPFHSRLMDGALAMTSTTLSPTQRRSSNHPIEPVPEMSDK